MTKKKLSFTASVRSRDMLMQVPSRKVTAEREAHSLPPTSRGLACITLNVKPNRMFQKVQRE